MSLCPHCENYLPARTFRRHRFIYFEHDSNTWEKDPDSGSSSNDDSDEYMQIDNDNFCLHPVHSFMITATQKSMKI